MNCENKEEWMGSREEEEGRRQIAEIDFGITRRFATEVRKHLDIEASSVLSL